MRNNLLPPNPFVADWFERPGESLTFGAMADWIEERDHDTTKLRQLMRLWSARVPRFPMPRATWGVWARLVSPEWCSALCAGFLLRSRFWLEERADPYVGYLLEDVTEHPEDAGWGTRDGSGLSLAARNGQAGAEVSAAIGAIRELYTREEQREDRRGLWLAYNLSARNQTTPHEPQGFLLDAVSRVASARMRLARIRVWRGQPRTGNFSGATHPCDLMNACRWEAATSRGMAAKSRTKGPQPVGRAGPVFEAAFMREMRWQVWWLACVGVVGGFWQRLRLDSLCAYIRELLQTWSI